MRGEVNEKRIMKMVKIVKLGMGVKIMKKIEIKDGVKRGKDLRVVKYEGKYNLS